MTTSTVEPVERKRIPGVEGIWVLIGADSVVFALLFASFMQARMDQPEVFETSRRSLNLDLGGLNTLILLTSSWAVALAIQALKRDRSKLAHRYLLLAMVTGLLFVGSKSTEYVEKLTHGVSPATC